MNTPKQFSTPLVFTVIFYLVTGLCLTGVVSGVDKPSVARVMKGPHAIDWEPLVEYRQLLLTVAAPDGRKFEKTFSPGETVVFEPGEAFTGILPEGTYNYELRVTPLVTRKRGRIGESAVSGIGRKPVALPPPVPSQSGYFTVLNGSIVANTAPENLSSTMDIVHMDDVIIDGSLCVGNDCYNGLAFGFDTIVLMENNLRIFFDDTSTIQNYPRNDWRIICNDSTDNGGKYFAIEDATEADSIFVLEAGAPSNSLYVDSHGDVGINTATPYYELHIVDGDSPAVRLDQDGSYGWTPQKWDLCGNESNFFIRDATHASKLPFRIEPEAPTDSIFIKSNGYIGLGTGSPSAPLEVETTGTPALIIADRTDGAAVQFSAGVSSTYFGSRSNHKMHLITNQIERVTVDTSGRMGIGLTSPSHKIEVYNSGGSNAYCDGGVWADGSSRKGKENIKSLSTNDAVNALRELDPVKFHYKGGKEEYLGFIAEDVPELVAMNDRKGLSPMDIVAVLTKVVQQQQDVIAAQQKISAEQQKNIAQMKAEIEALKKERK
jgi:hypothetical protein